MLINYNLSCHRALPWWTQLRDWDKANFHVLHTPKECAHDKIITHTQTHNTYFCTVNKGLPSRDTLLYYLDP